MSQMKEQEMAKEKESGSKPPLTPEESERLNQSVQKSEAQAPWRSSGISARCGSSFRPVAASP